MTDQDQDGSHIKGLIINFIHSQWPALLKHNFVEQFITPLVKVILLVQFITALVKAIFLVQLRRLPSLLGNLFEVPEVSRKFVIYFAG